MRAFRFGVVFTGQYEAKGWAELARRLEAEGWNTLLVADHYANPMACGPLLVAAASATTTLRVGSYVYNNDFRHPALLAKEAATIDVLSEGRLELGVGAGYYKEEYDAIGLPFDPPGVRAGRFEEAIDILKHLLAGEQVTFAGQHYQLNELDGMPLPIQQPLPLLIGGGGPRMLRLAARSADIVAFVPPALPDGGLDRTQFAPAALESKLQLLETAIGEAERTDDGPERSLLVFGVYTSVDEAAVEEWIPPELLATSPYALVGDVDAMVDALHERRERWGISYYVCFDRDLDKFMLLVRRLAAC